MYSCHISDLDLLIFLYTPESVSEVGALCWYGCCRIVGTFVCLEAHFSIKYTFSVALVFTFITTLRAVEISCNTLLSVGIHVLTNT